MTGAARLGRAQQAAPISFASPAEAARTLFDAVEKNDEDGIEKILGGSGDLASTRAEDQDKAARELFCRKYNQMHRLHRERDGSVTLYLGAENWPFPIPLVEKKGSWQFDPETGKKEVLFRQIGENEFTAMAICREFDAVKRGNSPAATGMNSAASLASIGTIQTSADPVLAYGYYFRVIPTRKGAALIAYPAEYGSSGVMTFASIGNNRVYQKDLGPRSSERGAAMASFRKDFDWKAAH
jgi:hypothetical protein